MNEEMIEAEHKPFPFQGGQKEEFLSTVLEDQ